jgi:sulfide:quinone oxidoreductase
MAHRVLVLGGGTGGTIVANSLDRRRFDTTVVSASADHLFQPGLLYVAFKGERARLVRDERRLLKHHVHLLQDSVTGVDLTEKAVDTRGGERLRYDQLVIATGITTDPSSIPGLAEVTSEVGNYHSSVDEAWKLWRTLNAFTGGTIALGQATPICKCPPSPVEGILLADELLRARGVRGRTRLIFFTPYPRPYPAEPMNRVVEPILKERGVEVQTFFDLDRIDPGTRTLTSIEGDVIECDLPIVIPPFVGAAIAYAPPETLDASRFVVTDPRTLRVKGADAAFAIGDATSLPTSKSGVGAHLEAKVVARTLSGSPSVFGGRTHCPLDVAGGRATFVAGTYDAPVVPSPPNRVKHLMKMAFARLYWLSLRGLLDPVFDGYFWLTDPARAARKAAGGAAGDRA